MWEHFLVNRKKRLFGQDAFFVEKNLGIWMEYFYLYATFQNRQFLIGAKTPSETYQLSTPTYPPFPFEANPKNMRTKSEKPEFHALPLRAVAEQKPFLDCLARLTNEFVTVFEIYQLFSDANNINRQPHNLVLISHRKYFSSVRRSICIEKEKQVSHISRNKNKQTNHLPSIPVIGQQS